MIKILISLLIISISCTDIEGRIVVDRFNEKHKYDIDDDSVDDESTLFCLLHYEWENIKYYYTRDGVKYSIRKQ